MYNLVIVDDETKIRNGLSNFFPWHEVGFRVVYEAKNGKDTLDYVQNHPVDVILSDIKMPVMSGIELLEHLYKQKSRVKVVFLTGYKEFEYAQKALVYGASNLIVKPTKYNELVNVFSKLRDDLDNERLDKINTSEFLEEYCNSDIVDMEDQGYHSKVISTIKSYVEENYATVTLEDVSKQVHLNSSYLSKYFKRKTGQNFSEFVLSVKMKKAAVLLDDIRYKVYDVSMMVGYDNAKNFTTTFKKYYGKSPKEYREKT